MPGRKRTPTSLKLARGNPGKRPISKSEPKPTLCAPNAPRGLSEGAKKHWRSIVKQLKAARVMTRLDVDALALYCEAYERWLDANEKVADLGVVITSPNGYPIQNPYLAISNKAFEQMRAMLIEFGMTPASREKVSTVKDDGTGADPWAEI